MKKVSAMILCIALVLAMIAVPAMAAQAATFTVKADKTTVNPGDTITVTVTIPAMTTKNVGIQLLYDDAVLTCDGGECGLAGGMLSTVNVKNSKASCTWAAASATSISGVAFTVKFTVKADAAGGNTTITYAQQKADGYDVSANNVTIKIDCKHTYGAWEKNNAETHKQTCSKCGDIKTEAHKWNAGETTTPAGCATAGVKTYTCSVCSETKTETIPATGKHNYGAWEKNNKDTHKATCTCGDVKTEAHKWNAGEITTPAGCATAGVKTFTCTTCGETKTETIPATGKHTYGAWEKNNKDTHKATCTCGDVKTEAHKWNAGEITTPADCKNDGVKTFTCTVCSETKTEAVPATGAHGYNTWTKVDDEKHTAVCSGCGAAPKTENHTWNAGEVKTPAGCDKAGVKLFTCTANGCGATKEEAIPATGNHTFGNWTPDGDVNHKRTCTTCQDGTPEVQTEAHKPGTEMKSDATNHWFECACGQKLSVAAHTYDKLVGDADGHTEGCVCGVLKDGAAKAPHTFDEGVVTLKPTNKKEGEKTFTCTACQFKKIEKIDKVSTPATGDNTLVIPMVILAVLSACGLAVTVVARKRASR